MKTASSCFLVAVEGHDGSDDTPPQYRDDVLEARFGYYANTGRAEGVAHARPRKPPAPHAPATAQPPPGAAPPAPNAQGGPGKPPGGDSAAVVDPNAPPVRATAKDHAAVAREQFRLRVERRKAKESISQVTSAHQKDLEDIKASIKAFEDREGRAGPPSAPSS